MLKYLAKRIGRSILTLFIIVTLVFCLLRLMPVEGYFANYEKMTEAQIQAGLQSMGLLDPLPVQIGRFWVNMLHGDLGVSHIYKVNASVTGILEEEAAHLHPDGRVRHAAEPCHRHPDGPVHGPLQEPLAR